MRQGAVGRASWSIVREIADGPARTFDCKNDPVEHRRGGKSPF
jgi:hypothetical protein